MNWYHHGLYGEKQDFKLVLFNCDTWFQISGYVNCQNNRFTMLIHDMSKHVLLRFVCDVPCVQRGLLDPYL